MADGSPAIFPKNAPNAIQFRPTHGGPKPVEGPKIMRGMQRLANLAPTIMAALDAKADVVADNLVAQQARAESAIAQYDALAQSLGKVADDVTAALGQTLPRFPAPKPESCDSNEGERAMEAIKLKQGTYPELIYSESDISFEEWVMVDRCVFSKCAVALREHIALVKCSFIDCTFTAETPLGSLTKIDSNSFEGCKFEGFLLSDLFCNRGFRHNWVEASEFGVGASGVRIGADNRLAAG